MFPSLAISLAFAATSISAIPVERPDRPDRAPTTNQSETPPAASSVNAPNRSGFTAGISLGVASSYVFFKSGFQAGTTSQDWSGPGVSLSIGGFLNRNVAILANLTLMDGSAEMFGGGLRLQLWPHDRFHLFAGVEYALGPAAERVGVGFSGGLGISVMALEHHSLYLYARGNYVLDTASNRDYGGNAATVQFGLGWQFH